MRAPAGTWRVVTTQRWEDRRCAGAPGPGDSGPGALSVRTAALLPRLPAPLTRRLRQGATAGTSAASNGRPPDPSPEPEDGGATALAASGDLGAPPARRRRTTPLEAVLELPANAPDLTPGGGETGRCDKHPVDVLYDFLQAAGGAAPTDQARAAMESKGLGPHFSTVVDFWTSINILVV